MNLVTGSGGFVGSRVALRLSAEGKNVRRLVRCVTGVGDELVGDLVDLGSLRGACEGVDTIFHCAGYAHAFSALGEEESRRHWQINFEGTRNLLEAAGEAGVKRFVFLSSVKAMAEPGELCVDEDFSGEPQTAYGRAKRAAEAVVFDIGKRYRMHVVCLRLAMVYGAGGHGNLERMGRLVKRGLFPPLPETGNRRSMVHVDDVVSAMCLVAGDMRASGRTYIVTGSETPSGRQLFDALRLAQELPPCRWSIPVLMLRLAAKMGDGLEGALGRRLLFDSEVLERLLGSACYSSARIERELGWRSRVSLADGLAEMLR